MTQLGHKTPWSVFQRYCDGCPYEVRYPTITTGNPYAITASRYLNPHSTSRGLSSAINAVHCGQERAMSTNNTVILISATVICESLYHAVGDYHITSNDSFTLDTTTLHEFWPARQLFHLLLSCAQLFQLTFSIAWMPFITVSIHLIFRYPTALEDISLHWYTFLKSLLRHSLYMT
jgi:hypothetical protein